MPADGSQLPKHVGVDW